MPKVPAYEQGQLASPVVGTPGVDTSGAALFNTIATASDGVATELARNVQANNTELIRRQREQAATAKVIQTAVQGAQVATIASNADAQAQMAQNKIRSDYALDPSSGMTAFNTERSRITQETLGRIQDPLTRAEAEKAILLKMDSHASSLNSWALTQADTVVKAQAKQQGDNLAILGNDAQTPAADFIKKLDEFDKSSAHTFLLAHGAEASAEVRKAKEGAVMNYLANTAIQMPGGLDDRINMFDKFIDAKNKEPFYARQKAYAREITMQQKQQDVLNQRSADMGAYSAITASDRNPTGMVTDAHPADIQAALKDPNLSPEARLKLMTMTASTQHETTNRGNDQVVVGKLGSYVTYANGLLDQVQTAQAAVQNAKGKARETAFVHLQQTIDKYQEVHGTITQLEKSIQTPEAKAAAKAFTSNTYAEYEHVRKVMTGEPHAQAFQTAKNTFKQTVGDPALVYASPQQQAVYNFYYRSKRDEVFREVATSGKLAKLTPAEYKTLQNRIRVYAQTQTETKGFMTRGH